MLWVLFWWMFFLRALVGQNVVNWHYQCASIVHIHLTEENIFRWNFHQNDQFSVRSIYLALIINGYIERNKIIWKLKICLKIKIFMLYLLKGVVLTKDNLAGGIRMVVWDVFNEKETIYHLFLDCNLFLLGYTLRIIYLIFSRISLWVLIKNQEIYSYRSTIKILYACTFQGNILASVLD